MQINADGTGVFQPHGMPAIPIQVWIHTDDNGEPHRQIGTELVRRMLALVEDRYMVDLCCDEDLVVFYERFGMQRWVGMGLRNRNALAD